MTKIACIYFEENDSKIIVFRREQNKLIVEKYASLDIPVNVSEKKVPQTVNNNGSNGQDYFYEDSTGASNTYIHRLKEFLSGEDMSKYVFIPVLAEPAVYFQKNNNKESISQLNVASDGKLSNSVDSVKVYDNSNLVVLPSGKSNYLQILNMLAIAFNKKYLKIAAVKNAELSLANLIINKYQPEKHTSIILYIGKNYAQHIYIKENKIFHIGSRISAGKNSFNSYNVILSKVMLELEQVSVGKIDTVFLSGEYDSKEFLSSLKEVFPKSSIKEVKPDVNTTAALNLPGAEFTIPSAATEEFVTESERKIKGIDLLPNHIRDEQKVFQLGWQGYLIILLIVLSGVFFMMLSVQKYKKSEQLDLEIAQLTKLNDQNKTLVGKINVYQEKMQNFDKIHQTLGTLSEGTKVLSNHLNKLSSFTGANRNIWLNQLTLGDDKTINIVGTTFSRKTAKYLAESYPNMIFHNVVYEPVREVRAFKFQITQNKEMAVK